MLSIRDLTHTYPNGVTALDSVNLDIPRGMFGLLGPNGAGKSSLMRTLATLQQPTSGTVHFGDIDVIRDPESLRKVLGYLPQDFGVYPRGSAYAHLDHLAVLKGLTDRAERKTVVEHLLTQTNLYDVRHKRLASYSGGMRQRFGVAQALLGSPQLIVVDEPTAGLDPEERNRFHNLLAEIGEEIVVILSTHIVEDVADLCPNMAILAKGIIVAHGTPADLKRELQGRVWECEVPKGGLNTMRAAMHVLSSHLSSGKVVVRVLADAAPDSDFRPAAIHLEDVYFSAVNPNGQAVEGRGQASAS